MGQNYLIIVAIDYYSNFPEICLLHDTHTTTVIKHMKSVFLDMKFPRQL